MRVADEPVGPSREVQRPDRVSDLLDPGPEVHTRAGEVEVVNVREVVHLDVVGPGLNVEDGPPIGMEELDSLSGADGRDQVRRVQAGQEEAVEQAAAGREADRLAEVEAAGPRSDRGP